MSLFPLFFSLFCRKTTYNVAWMATARDWKVCAKTKPNKQDETHKYMHIYFFWVTIFPRLAQNERQAEWNGVWALSVSDKIFERILFLFFFYGRSLSSHPWMMSWGDDCAWLADSFLFFFLLLSLSAWRSTPRRVRLRFKVKPLITCVIMDDNGKQNDSRLPLRLNTVCTSTDCFAGLIWSGRKKKIPHLVSVWDCRFGNSTCFGWTWFMKSKATV